ncbi:DMT family transporter [Stutzerimonas chloritidismutans]
MKRIPAWTLALIGITVLWGWSFVAIHAALNEISASAFNAYRFLSGALFLLPALIITRKRISLNEICCGVLAGVVLFFAFAFQTSGIKWTTASNASFITGLAIVFTPLFAYSILKITPHRNQMLGAIVATVGLAFLTLREMSIQLGDALVLACAIFTALHIVVLSKFSIRMDATVLAFIQVLVVGLLSIVWSAWVGQLSLPSSGTAVWTILVIGSLGTALAYFVQTKAQAESPPSRVALILVLEPVFGGFFGYLIGGDRLGAINVFGACLIILGMVITELDANYINTKYQRLKSALKMDNQLNS